VQCRLGREVDAGVVQAGEFVAQVHGDAVGEAGDDPEDASFPPEQGRSPLFSVVIAEGQSMAAMGGSPGGP
jgi:hypothetical protein